jgi:hypothetical protein
MTLVRMTIKPRPAVHKTTGTRTAVLLGRTVCQQRGREQLLQPIPRHQLAKPAKPTQDKLMLGR